jgi:hypothetical protein
MNTLSEVEAALDEGRLRVKVEAGFLPATRLSETKWDETGRYWLILIEVVPATIARLYISSMPGSPAFRIEGRQN